MAKKLTAAEKRQALDTLAGWQEMTERDAISKIFVFADFNTAFAWMTRIAMQAETLNHHPEWSNVYKSVTVTLTTHDAGGLSHLDIDMARFMDKTAEAMHAKTQ